LLEVQPRAINLRFIDLVTQDSYIRMSHRALDTFIGELHTLLLKPNARRSLLFNVRLESTCLLCLVQRPTDMKIAQMASHVTEVDGNYYLAGRYVRLGYFSRGGLWAFPLL